MATKSLVFKTELQKYTAENKPLGGGGSGQVFAVAGEDGEQYAIKVLSPELATSSKLKRFMNELTFGRKVRHDHIVPVLDSGFVELRTKTTPFFVMPRYRSSLRSLVDEGMSAERALGLFDGLAAGLSFAHAKSVWHRDIKPENILYDDATGRLLIADFGIAHFEEDLLLTAVETKNADRLANFAYAAPEQRRKGGAVDHRADIYAAGLILCEMVTGQVPHGTGYRRVGAVSPLHAYVDTVVERAIRNDPDDRYQSVDALRTDLQLLSAGPGLAVARAVGSTLAAAQEKDRLFWAPEGVSEIRRQVAQIYDHVEAVLKVIAAEQPVLKIKFEREGSSITLRTTQTSATVNWYQDASNMLERARLTIWTYKAIPFSFGKRDETGETEFWPDYTVNDGLCWRDGAGRNLTARAVADSLVQIFFENVRAHERAEGGADE
jgi:hypothetical protein